jgi:hypothetical protein
MASLTPPIRFCNSVCLAKIPSGAIYARIKYQSGLPLGEPAGLAREALRKKIGSTDASHPVLDRMTSVLSGPAWAQAARS